MICSEYHMENGTYINNIRLSSNRLAQVTAEVKAYETVIFWKEGIFIITDDRRQLSLVKRPSV